MNFQDLKRVTPTDVSYLADVFHYWHANKHHENLIDSFVLYHNAIIETGVFTYTLHKGDKNKKRCGFTYYSGGKNGVVSFDIDETGFKFKFFRGFKDDGTVRDPYEGQSVTSFNKKDWCWYIYLTYQTLGAVCKCSETSARLLPANESIVIRCPRNILADDTATQQTPLANDLKEPLPERAQTTVLRILRDTELSRRIKVLHHFKCQICGHRITLKDGSFYAEAHHIQPLGEPHNGQDIEENIICVCPNHHAELDYSSIELNLPQLPSLGGHKIGQKYVDYHNQWHHK